MPNTDFTRSASVLLPLPYMARRWLYDKEQTKNPCPHRAWSLRIPRAGMGHSGRGNVRGRQPSVHPGSRHRPPPPLQTAAGPGGEKSPESRIPAALFTRRAALGAHLTGRLARTGLEPAARQLPCPRLAVRGHRHMQVAVSHRATHLRATTRTTHAVRTRVGAVCHPSKGTRVLSLSFSLIHTRARTHTHTRQRPGHS